MKEIFEGAKFGDKFVTRDGNVAIFHRRFIRTCHAAPSEPSYQGVSLMVKGQAYLVEKGLDGKDMTDYYITTRSEQPTDIIGRWKEPIDECKVEKLSKESNPYDKSDSVAMHDAYSDGFYDGYCKAKEE